MRSPPRWSIAGDVLLVDDDEDVRRSCVAALKGTGCRCVDVESYEKAREVVDNDPAIRVVLIDHGLDPRDTQDFVRHVQESALHLLLVGMSGADRRRDFDAMGVTRFLRKPWRPRQLIDALYERIDCSDCGSHLPLRWALPGEYKQTRVWCCTSCGAPYRAVLDESCPPGIRDNARPNDDS